MEDHYIAWRQAHDSPQHSFGSESPFSFCSFPFLLSPRAKSKLLHTEARFLMTQVRLAFNSLKLARLRKPMILGYEGMRLMAYAIHLYLAEILS